MSAKGQTKFTIRNKLELVRLKAEGNLASLIEEVKIIINWLSSEDDELNQYRLRIYWIDLITAVVVVSNVTNLPGNKIADITPQIIDFVSNHFDLSIDKFMLVEYYSISSLRDDLYLHVLRVNNELIRYEISKDELTQLIGKPI